MKIHFHHTHLNLTKSQSFEKDNDNLTSYHFHEIELERECEPDPQFENLISLFDSMLTLISLPDLNNILESVLNHVPINLEIESSIFQHYISLMGNVCKPQIFGLDLILEPILTSKSLLDLKQIPESELIPFELKPIIFQNHTQLSDKCVE